MNVREIQLPTIDEFPTVARVFVTAYLVTTGFGYNYALAQLGMQVGTSPQAVAAHYHGGTVGKAAPPPAAPAGGEQDVDLDAAVSAPKAPAVVTKQAPSMGALVQAGHTHVFGQTSLFFAVAGIALFLRVRPGLKTLLVLLPFAAIVVDHLGFLATRFVGPQFVWMIILSGSAMAATHFVVTALTCWQAWFRKVPLAAAETAHA